MRITHFNGTGKTLSILKLFDYRKPYNSKISDL